MSNTTKRMQIWPIASGKGGVGKTLITANLGIVLSRMNLKVVILDADLGASNLHTLLGIHYLKRTLNDLLTGRSSELSQVVVDTEFSGLRLIGGSRHLPTHPEYASQLAQKIRSGIYKLDADILLLDLGGGIGPDVLDLFLLSNQGIMVTTNDPSSIQNTYQFLKMAVYRKILKSFPSNPLISYMIHSATQPRKTDAIRSIPELVERISHVDHYYAEVIQNLLERFSPRMIVNMVDNVDDVRAARVVSTVSSKFSGISPILVGTVGYSPAIKKSTLGLRPFTLDPESSVAAEQLNLIARRLLRPEDAAQPTEAVEKAPASEKKEIWYMDNVLHENRPFHVLTEKLQQDGAVQTSIYSRGRIVFSRKLVYSELTGGLPDEGELQRIVRKQHLTALKGIESGRLPLKAQNTLKPRR